MKKFHFLWKNNLGAIKKKHMIIVCYINQNAFLITLVSKFNLKPLKNIVNHQV